MAEHLPLSRAQHAQWFLHLRAPGSSAYNTGVAVRVHSVVNLDALRTAVSELGERHDMLRSVFGEHDGLPVRMVLPRSPLRLRVRSVPGTDPERLREEARREVIAPFALGETGAFRAVLLQREPDDGVLLVAGHHIATDATSDALLLRDLLRAYHRITTGSSGPEDTLVTTYQDYVEKEKQLLGSPRADAMRAHWQEVCRGSAAATLPTDQPRRNSQSFGGATHHVIVPARTSFAVQAAAGRAEVSLFAWLLGTFQAVLHRYSRQNDFLVGCPVTTRLSSANRDVVGNFVNTIVVRARLTGTDTFSAVALAVHEQLRTGVAAVRYPFSLLPAAIGRGQPAELYRIMLNLLSVKHLGAEVQPMLDTTREDHRTNYHGLVLSPLRLPQQEGQLDLGVDVLDSGGELAADFRYDGSLFETETIERLADAFLAALAISGEDPACRIGRARLWDGRQHSAVAGAGRS